MDFVRANLKKEVLLIYMQRPVPGRGFEGIGNLGTLTLASRLQQEGFDGIAYTGITSDAVHLIRRRMPALLAVCFYCDFDNQSAIKSVIRHLRKEYEHPCFLLIGGPQTMHMTTSDAENFRADAILLGDGEESLPKWLKVHAAAEALPHANCGNASDDSFCPGNSVVLPAFPEELTSDKEGVYRTLTDFSSYRTAQETYSANRIGKIFSVISARGCPHRCAFCFEGGNSKLLRPRPVEEVLSEIRQRLAGENSLSYLFFADDTFTFDRSRLHEFCLGLKEIRKRREFGWFCEGHASFFRRYPDAVREMTEAGLVRMQIGMESGSDQILKAYRKGIRGEDILYTAQLCQEAGLPQLAGNFIIGGALETPESLESTRQFMLDLMERFPGMLDLSTTFPIPLPGTSLTEDPGSYEVVWDDILYETSLEDVPVNHTYALDRYDISRGRQAFIAAMVTKMRELFTAGKVPEEKIRQNFELWFRYGITDSWGKLLFRQDQTLCKYYQAVLRDGYREYLELEPQNKGTAIPVPLLRPEESGEDEQVRKLLSLCNGKTIRQIGTSTGLGTQELESALFRAAKAHSLVFLA